MGGDLERHEGDPGWLRVSHADRDRVAEVLRRAAGDGRLDLDELEQRLEATYAAKTYADLTPITFDLPAGPGEQPLLPQHRAAPDATSATAGRSERAFAVLGAFDRKGAWTVPEHLTVVCFWGGAEIDLREATFSAPEVVLTIHAVMGGASVIVGPGTRVVLEGTGVMGGYTGPSGLVGARLDASSPTVRIRGVAVWGGVSVERKHLPGPA